MNTNEVIDYIVDVSGKSRSYFLNGGCLLFAKELQSKIGGSLLYLLVESHFVLSLDSKLYDCTGNVTNKYRGSKAISLEEFYARPKLSKTILQ